MAGNNRASERRTLLEAEILQRGFLAIMIEKTVSLRGGRENEETESKRSFDDAKRR